MEETFQSNTLDWSSLVLFMFVLFQAEEIRSDKELLTVRQ